MEKDYWLRRRSVASMMAREATIAEAALIRYDRAGRYAVKIPSGATRRLAKPRSKDRGREDHRHDG